VALTTWFVCVLICTSVHAETLVETDVRYRDLGAVDRGPEICALKLGGDTMIYCSSQDVFLQVAPGAPWRMLTGDALGQSELHYDYCEQGGDIEQLADMKRIWRVTDNDEIIVYDGYCSHLFAFHLRTGEKSAFTRWRKQFDEGWPRVVNIQGRLVLCGMARFSGPRSVYLFNIGERGHEELFEYSSTLADRLDSVGLDYGQTFCFPAWSPRDSSLWIAVYGYDYIYVTDINGRVKDSVRIDTEDYKVPPQIKSRIRSTAVAIEWGLQWTQITSFQYVPSGYFLLQYHLRYDYTGGVKTSVYSTAVWDADGRPVPLPVDHRWQLASVQPDGDIIFACYRPADSGCRLELHTARIEP